MMNRRLPLLAIAVSLSVATPVAAELPPYVYEQARAQAVDVVVIHVRNVSGLPDGVTRGDCQVDGEITTVERGERSVGEMLTLKVPCVTPDNPSMPGPWPGHAVERLTHTETAQVWLDAEGGLVLRGYDLLD